MFGHCVGGSCCHQHHDDDGRGALDYVRYATFHIEPFTFVAGKIGPPETVDS